MMGWKKKRLVAIQQIVEESIARRQAKRERIKQKKVMRSLNQQTEATQ